MSHLNEFDFEDDSEEPINVVQQEYSQEFNNSSDLISLFETVEGSSNSSQTVNLNVSRGIDVVGQIKSTDIVEFELSNIDQNYTAAEACVRSLISLSQNYGGHDPIVEQSKDYVQVKIQIP